MTSRNIKSFLATLSLLSVQFYCLAQVKFVEDPVYTNLLDSARSSQKEVLLVCCTKWCAPCKTLKEEYFKDKEVAQYINNDFIVAYYDMEISRGVPIAKKYGVIIYPSLLIVDSDGQFFDRIEGLHESPKVLLQTFKEVRKKGKKRFAGVSASIDLQFPEFYNEYFEAPVKKEVSIDVVNNYLSKQKDLYSEVNWRVYTLFKHDTSFDEHLFNNFPTYKVLYDYEATQKLNTIIQRKLKIAIDNKNESLFLELKKYMEDNGLSKERVMKYAVAFYGKTCLDWSKYIVFVNAYVKQFNGSITEVCSDIFDKCYTEEVAKDIFPLIEKKISENPSPWLFIFKGLFLEAANQADESQMAYKKAIELSPPSTKEIYKGHIRNMQQRLCTTFSQ